MLQCFACKSTIWELFLVETLAEWLSKRTRRYCPRVRQLRETEVVRRGTGGPQSSRQSAMDEGRDEVPGSLFRWARHRERMVFGATS